MAKYCNKCNSLIEDGGFFCTECGSNDIRDEAAQAKVVPTTPATAPVMNQPLVDLIPNTGDVAPANVQAPVANSVPEIPAVAPNLGDPVKVDTPSIPQVGTINTNPPEQNKNSFADVPDFMGGTATNTSTVSMPDTTIAVPKDFQLQNDTKDNDYSNNLDLETINANRAIGLRMQKRKKMKKKIFMILGIVFAIVAVFLIIFMFYYGKAIGAGLGKGPFNDSDITASGNNNSGFDYSTIFTPENSFRVGSPEFGYISIPNTWSKFKDVDGNSTLQYTDDGTWIVTIYAMPTTSLSAKDWANSVYKAISDAGGQNLTATTSTIDSYSALMVTAYYPVQGKYLSTWFFESKSGKTHYLAIEGPDNKGDNYNCIYSFKEDK